MNRFLLAKHAEGRAPSGAAAGPLALLLAPHVPHRVHRRSRLASGPAGLQQNANLFLREPQGSLNHASRPGARAGE